MKEDLDKSGEVLGLIFSLLMTVSDF